MASHLVGINTFVGTPGTKPRNLCRVGTLLGRCVPRCQCAGIGTINVFSVSISSAICAIQAAAGAASSGRSPCFKSSIIFRANPWYRNTARPSTQGGGFCKQSSHSAPAVSVTPINDAPQRTHAQSMLNGISRQHEPHSAFSDCSCSQHIMHCGGYNMRIAV